MTDWEMLIADLEIGEKYRHIDTKRVATLLQLNGKMLVFRYEFLKDGKSKAPLATATARYFVSKFIKKEEFDAFSTDPSPSQNEQAPIPMLLDCPRCHQRHIDVGEFVTKIHHTHACQTCGLVWRPAIVPTVGVMFLPGFKND